jgi:DNA (cytosine-5)-methyltransferase 1
MITSSLKKSFPIDYDGCIRNWLLGLEIRRQVFKRQVRKSLRLIPKARRPDDKKDKVHDVNNKYLDLIAEHQEHPGVGKGPGAAKALKGV